MANTKVKIMCVDDEPDITSTIQKMLENHGWQVDAFNDPEQALSRFKPKYYDCIIVDIRMPVMNGFQLVKRIWARDETARICFLSAFEIYDEEVKKVFKGFKAHSFLKKPITASELINHIEAQIVKRDN
jgi:DNA-binding response OmpR family regulator